MKTPSLPLLVALLTLLLASCASGPGSSADSAKLQRIQNIIVIYAENHSFDNLYDNLFQGAFRGSFLNHQWLVCACTPRIDNAPDAMRVRPDNNGKLLKKSGSPSANVGAAQIFSDGIGGQVTSDGYAVNPSQPSKEHMLVIVTYDENDGYWDHVPPPTGAGWRDRWGPGSRVLASLIGPGVRRGPIDSTSYDTTSIRKLIASRFGLEPLPGVRANSGDLSVALQ